MDRTTPGPLVVEGDRVVADSGDEPWVVHLPSPVLSYEENIANAYMFACAKDFKVQLERIIAAMEADETNTAERIPGMPNLKELKFTLSKSNPHG